MMVRGKYEQNSTDKQSNNQTVTQRTNTSINEGTIEVKSGSDVVTVFFGDDNVVTTDTMFYDIVKVIGPSYDKQKEERVFSIKSVKNKLISMTKAQAKVYKLAYVMRICGITEPGSTLEVFSTKRDLPTNGNCSD